MVDKKIQLIFLIIILILITGILTLLYLLEKCIFSLFNLVIDQYYIIIIIMILLHFMLFRFLVRKIVFPGSSYLIQKSIYFVIGISNAKKLAHIISSFRKACLYFVKENRNETIYDGKNLSIMKSSYNSFKKFLQNSKKISSMENISSQQKFLAENFGDIITIIEKSEIFMKIEENISNKEINILNSKNDIKNILDSLIQLTHKVEQNVKSYTSKNPLIFFKNFFFNDSFCSRSKFKLDLLQRYNHEELKITAEKGKIKIDALLIKTHQNISLISNKKLMILCGPNGNPYEFTNYYWLDFYMENNICVLLWNYRGYGESEGIPSFSSIREDVVDVFNYMKKNYQWEKISVHGISIGNLGSCKLASENLVDFCFADRAFSSIEDIILNYPFGKYIRYLYKFLLFDNSSNVENYLNSNCYKVMSCDPNDSIIIDGASLKSGISRKIINDHINFNEKTTLLLIKILGYDFHNFSVSLNFLINLVNKNDSSFSNPYQSKTGYEKMESLKDFNLGVIGNESEERTLQKIKNFFSEIDAVGQTLNDMDGYIGLNPETFFNDFFSNLLVWGSYNSEEGFVVHRKEAVELAKRKLFNLTTNISKILDGSIFNTLSQIQNKNLLVVREGLDKIYNSFLKETSLNDCDEEKISNGNNEICIFQSSRFGYIMKLDCGHNGMFNNEEILVYKNFLIDSKMIN